MSAPGWCGRCHKPGQIVDGWLCARCAGIDASIREVMLHMEAEKETATDADPEPPRKPKNPGKVMRAFVQGLRKGKGHRPSLKTRQLRKDGR